MEAYQFLDIFQIKGTVCEKRSSSQLCQQLWQGSSRELGWHIISLATALHHPSFSFFYPHSAMIGLWGPMQVGNQRLPTPHRQVTDRAIKKVEPGEGDDGSVGNAIDLFCLLKIEIAFSIYWSYIHESFFLHSTVLLLQSCTRLMMYYRGWQTNLVACNDQLVILPLIETCTKIGEEQFLSSYLSSTFLEMQFRLCTFKADSYYLK